MVILNDQSSATTQTILISGLPAGTYNITGVDPASTNPTLGTARTYPPQTVTAAGTLQIDLPPQALVTFVQQ